MATIPLTAIPLVRASSVRPLFRFAEGGGTALRPFRDRLQPAFRGEESLLPLALVGSMFEDIARAAGLEDAGFRIGVETPIETFGAWGGLLARSPTVGAFLDAALAGYRHFNTGYRLWTVVRGDELWLFLRFSRALRRGRGHVIDFALMMWLAAFRRMLGPAWRPREIHLEGEPPRYAREMEALATHRICYRQPTPALVLPRDLLACPTRIPSVARFPSLETCDPAPDFAGSVRQTVVSLLQLGLLDLSSAAEMAGMSERSFQRRLAGAGLCFSRLVGEARFDVAHALLADRALRVIDVSTALGYRDSANFTRAFRRWTGVSPQRFRRVGSAGASELVATPFLG